MSGDFLLTLRQSLPRMAQLLTKMRPTFDLDSAADVNAGFLERHGVQAVLWDVDGTVMAYHSQDVDPAFAHLRELFRNGPARHAMLSNCDEERFELLGRIFPEVPIVRGYTTDDGLVFRNRSGGRDTHDPGQVEELLANGDCQIRKPSGELVRYGMQLLEVGDPNSVLMVGDQYLTDVASANLAGARSAKVKTFRRDTFPLTIRFAQRLEQVLYLLGSRIS
jgi:predicted HAD superfamily phosphohydrolase YqeG